MKLAQIKTNARDCVKNTQKHYVSWLNDMIWFVAAFTAALVVCFGAYFFYRKKWPSKSNWQAIQQIVEQFKEPGFMFDEDGKILHANSAACDFLGHTLESITQLTLWDIDKECYIRRHPNAQASLNLQNFLRFKTTFRHKDGSNIPVDNKIQKLVINHHAYYVCFTEDSRSREAMREQMLKTNLELERSRNTLESRIQEQTVQLKSETDERVRAQKAAHHIRYLLQNIIDSMPSAVIAINDYHEVSEWNKQAEELTRIQAEHAIGAQLKLVIPNLYDPIFELINQIKPQKQKASGRIQLVKDGKICQLDIMVYRLAESALEAGLVIRVDDVTEKNRIEEQLIQSEKMLSLGGLAAGMAHEINNPLGAIVQGNQNIQRRLNPSRPRNQQLAEDAGISMESVHKYLVSQKIPHFLDTIHEAGLKAAAIVSDMLRFARPGGSDMQEIDLSESLDAAIRLATTTYKPSQDLSFKQIKIERKYAPQTGRVYAPKNSLEQVFLNLLMNAAQAMANAGTDAPQIAVTLHQAQRQAIITFSDNGPGMTESTKRRVFEPFFTTKPEGQGTGLGLSISFFIITEQLKGKIDVESAEGQGCQFTIQLPISSSDQRQVVARHDSGDTL